MYMKHNKQFKLMMKGGLARNGYANVNVEIK